MLPSPGVLRIGAPLALAGLVVLSTPGAARAADWLDLWAEAGGGADDNPARMPGASSTAYGFATLLARARVRVEGESAAATLNLTEAGRLYPDARGSDALASRLEASGRTGLGGGFSAAFSGVASDYTERAGLLDRHALRGEGSLGVRRGSLRAALAGGWALFTPRESTLRSFRSSGPEGWVRAGWTPAEGHELSAALGLSRADFPGWAALGAPGSSSRSDRAQHLSAEWAWRGAAVASVGWAFTLNRSDAPGGDFTRHRLTASSAVRLPLELTLAARLALQLTRYPDPLLLAAQQRLAEGQENLDAVEARFTRPVTEALEVSLALAWYHAQGGAGVPGYERSVATLALGWRSKPAGR